MSNSSAARPELPMVARLILSFVLFFGGIALLAVAFRIPEWEGLLFIVGLLVTSLGLGIAIHQRRPIGH